MVITCNNSTYIRYAAWLLLVLTLHLGCQKDKAPRKNFAELTVGNDKIVFDTFEAMFDTSAQGFTCNFRFEDRATHSNTIFEIQSGPTNWIIGTYEYPGHPFPERSLVFLHLQTYVNRLPNTYTLNDTSLKLIVDQSGNWRIHGTFSGKLTRLTGTPYGAAFDCSGEFEMPYSYR